MTWYGRTRWYTTVYGALVRPPYISVFLRKRSFTTVHIRPETETTLDSGISNEEFGFGFIDFNLFHVYSCYLFERILYIIWSRMKVVWFLFTNFMISIFVFLYNWTNTFNENILYHFHSEKIHLLIVQNTGHRVYR